jgi:purine-cytosine permease-like protein
MTVSSFALGALSGPVFGLAFVDSFLTILFINALGVLPVAFYSTLGARFGLRQMVLSRYWFGYHAVKICMFLWQKIDMKLTGSLVAIINSLAAVGWSAVNSIVGAQLFHAVNPRVPGWAGIIIIAAGTGIVTLFGYRVVHLYQKWSWVPGFIVFLIVLGEFAHSGQFQSLALQTGSAEVGSVLSFAAALFGNSTGWSTYAADYTVYMRSSPMKIFVWTYVGLFFPLVFTQSLGAAVVTATTHNAQYMTDYYDSGVGGLLGAVLFPPLGGFGRFCVVLLALGIIANNCPNQYSIALNLQMLSKGAQRVPRFLWTTLSVVVFAAVAIPGYSSFESVLKNFMLIMVRILEQSIVMTC